MNTLSCFSTIFILKFWGLMTLKTVNRDMCTLSHYIVNVPSHLEIGFLCFNLYISGYHRKKTEDAKQLLGTSENIFPSPQMDQVPRFQSTPMVQRQSYLIKRPSPYGKPGKTLMQKTATDQRQNLASKQDSLQTSFNSEENYSNFKSSTESQSVTIANTEGSVDSANDIKISGIGSLKDIENIPQGTESLTEVNDSLIDDENAGINIKREPGDMLNDPNSGDNTGAGGLTEGMDSGQWDTSAGLGEGSFDASGQDYGKELLSQHVCLSGERETTVSALNIWIAQPCIYSQTYPIGHLRENAKNGSQTVQSNLSKGVT